ncbi:hypothetical protein RF11_14127 [Thelohanellus kitauei]|uniref:Uncharacterized protein n=1 Tax=Thelohanellus kitauei TaxID=669202 RepID=A0A0C2NEC8_THEKT|nr:hypothetical protein RF11_14127 [Thelohanellus kitauei]
MIKCNCTELETEIEIGECHLSILLKDGLPINEHHYRPKHRFKKYTKYEFSEFLIKFKDFEEIFNLIEVTIYNITIEFKQTVQTCEWNNKNQTTLLVDFESTELIDHRKSNGITCSVEKNITLPSVKKLQNFSNNESIIHKEDQKSSWSSTLIMIIVIALCPVIFVTTYFLMTAQNNSINRLRDIFPA